MSENNYKCPYCGTTLKEHVANKCLDAWAAEVVLGWERTEESPNFLRHGGVMNYKPRAFSIVPNGTLELLEGFDLSEWDFEVGSVTEDYDDKPEWATSFVRYGETGAISIGGARADTFSLAVTKGAISAKLHDARTKIPTGRELDTWIDRTIFRRHEHCGTDRNVPYYSSVWNTSKQVFDWLAERGLVKLSNGDGDSCDVDFVPTRTPELHYGAHVSAATFEEAICLAAYGAVNGIYEIG